METKQKIHTIDAAGQILGRLAVQVANILRGRNKPDYLPYKDMGENVVVFNVDKIKVSGKKMKQKVYYRYSGYPGGLKKRRLEEVMERDSREALRKAVYGMLPKNRLRDKMIKKLKMYKLEIK